MHRSEPLRLLAVAEAPREKVRQVLDKQSAVRELAGNGWLSLVVLEAGRFYRWTLSDRWIEIDDP